MMVLGGVGFLKWRSFDQSALYPRFIDPIPPSNYIYLIVREFSILALMVVYNSYLILVCICVSSIFLLGSLAFRFMVFTLLCVVL